MAAKEAAADPTVAGPAAVRTAPFASAWRRAHLTVDERVDRGRAARTEVPRSAHGRRAAPDRPDPVAPAGRTGGKPGRGFTPDERRAVVMAGTAEYRDRMRLLAVPRDNSR